ncbi:glycosyltransferase [Pleomorphovibrio marinus]|uniref:glycosyltransferase n=1 Tax=Pleomorphovibrio marinus TaxID=2164132 RepID=UPI0013004330|nr:glycosyltransferase [Pleomorphovibrio marinus]
MTLLLGAAIMLVGISILQFTLYMWDGRRNAPKTEIKYSTEGELPKVAVFISARNECLLLPECLLTLEKMDYPSHLIDFYIADDNSEDGTAEILLSWVKKEENRHGFLIREEPGTGINGKARALAKMTEVTDADLFLFTDADCSVPSTWVRSMVSAYKVAYGMVIGITEVKRTGPFSTMQALDWFLHLGVIKHLSDKGHSLTAMGNNMLIASNALKKAGGFRAVERSVTEDLAICRSLYEIGYRPYHLVESGNLVKTKAEGGLTLLLQQRKRWAVGAMGLPWYWKFILFIQVAFFPAIVFICFQHLYIGAILWAGKIYLQSMFLIKFAKKTETIFNQIDLFIFEWFYLFTTWATAIYYFWPSKIKWKKRAY